MFAITLDIDWAPDFIIESVTDLLIEQGVKSTWFITHESAAVNSLSGHSALIERGIHPNFMTNSSHGASYSEVMQNIKKIVPDAKCVRTHALYQSNPLLKLMCVEHNIKIDSSLFLRDYQNVQPIQFEFAQDKTSLIRIPYIWGDQYEITRSATNLKFFKRFEFAGIKVFNFHPVHIYFNACDDTPYKNLKLISSDISKATKESCDHLINRKSKGVKDFLIDLIQEIKKTGDGVTLSEISKTYSAK